MAKKKTVKKPKVKVKPFTAADHMNISKRLTDLEDLLRRVEDRVTWLENDGEEE